ncbi:hypothetical protein JTF06_10700 [Desemzia sp. RIT804]|uniref:hypothetical protein n=1 Tax=Desemzia sp. RIT 804 TaxID=2810209 RepID=UPI0019529745|nr:hypothetical protein [Desemzia sp. RIT 804]MBM6615357.1 hypothetical protein [Desemzia sp. RIT 804]
MTLDFSLDMIYSLTNNGYICIQSLNLADKEYFTLVMNLTIYLDFGGLHSWRSISLATRLCLEKGLIGIVSSELPTDVLSSSVAVTTAYLMVLCDVNDIEVSKLDLINTDTE